MTESDQAGEHQWSDWIEIGLGANGEKRWRYRVCRECGEREREWQSVR